MPFPIYEGDVMSFKLATKSLYVVVMNRGMHFNTNLLEYH